MRTFIKFQYLLLFVFCFSFSFAQSEIQTIRIDFQNPEGFTRHLALGFLEDNSATDGIDYGYDAPNIDDLQNDLNWMIEDSRYVIQGVGAFNATKYYPMGMFLTNSGEVTISLNTLENFQNAIDVYLYDLELDTYTLLNDSGFTQNISAGNYIDRFFIAFSSDAHLNISADYLLSVNDEKKDEINVRYSKELHHVYVSGLPHKTKAKLTLYSILGEKVRQEDISKDKSKVNTLGISEGIYLVKIETSTFTHSAKVYISN